MAAKFGQELDLKCLLELQEISKTFTSPEASADLVDFLKTAVETECTAAVEKTKAWTDDPGALRTQLAESVANKRAVLNKLMLVLGSRCEARFCGNCVRED